MTGQIDPEGAAGSRRSTTAAGAIAGRLTPERLERAGVSWRIYHDLDDYDCNVTKYFTQFQNAPTTSPLYDNALADRPFYELLWDIRTGNIPQVSRIVPPSDLSEHPDYLPARRQRTIPPRCSQRCGPTPPLWARTALIINYDENDALRPRHAADPLPGTPGEFIGGLPIGLGYRVPARVISPFSRGGHVCGETPTTPR